MESAQNKAFYLKYRPQSLDGLVGQDHIKKSLYNSFQSNKLSHAYLFVGPRGTGKTSTARILAKMVNCEGKGERGKGEVPCNECITCISITDGSNLDLIEIDAASNRGIEDIRSLREKIKLSPTVARKKVYIIDEVHMLTQEAFNALLKTLEEPPSHALFILATTDVGKLPQTILSRVQRLDFKLASNEELLQALKKIVQEEKIGIEDNALNFLIKKAEGSFRDGVKLLDQATSGGEKITVEVLEKLFKSSNFERLIQLLESFAKKDTTLGLTLILKAVEEGVDIRNLTLSLMDIFRNLVFIKNGLGEQLVKSNYEELVKLSEGFTNSDLIKTLDILQKSLEKLKFASIQSLPLELAIVEVCSQEPGHTAPVIASEAKQSSLANNPIQIASLPSALRNDDQEQVENLTSNLPPLTSNDDIQKLKEKWTFVLETIRPFNFSLEALLRSVNIKECTNTDIIMEVPYSFHQRILESPKNKDLLESILSDILGRSIKVSTVLGVRIPKKEDIANIEVAQDDEIIRAAAEIFSSDSIN